MKRLLKTDLQRRSEQIKQLLLSGKPFAQELADLYIDLSLRAKHQWTIQTFQLLSLYVPANQKTLLYHPALLQAFLAIGDLKQAKYIGQALLKQNPQDPETNKFLCSLNTHTFSTLPAYTPIVNLSRYAQGATAHTSKKSGLDLPAEWQQTLAALTPQKLQAIGYYDKLKQLARAPRAYRCALKDNFNQLVLNYLFQYHRAVVVLSGALLESLLIIHAYEQLKLRHISLRGKKDSKNILDASLHELLHLYATQELLPAHTLRLCRAARMQRNFIHPGKELTEKIHLSPTASQICFLAVLELIDALLPPSKTSK